MSSRGGSSSNGGGLQSIPVASRKVVQSLKEILDYPECEIYAMLKECNMDPNETVNRLLSQDPFHKVKSKREKRKENKDTTEARTCGVSNTSNRVVRGISDRYTGQGGSTQFSLSESDALYGKPAYKKESGTHNYTSPPSLAFVMTGDNLNHRPLAQSDPVTSENKGKTVGTVDGSFSSSHPPSGYQAAWSGVPGQVSMADIVKMGSRPHSKASSGANPSPYGVNQHHVHTSRPIELNHEVVIDTDHHVSPNDDWPLIEQPPAVHGPLVLEQHMASDLHVVASNLSSDSIKEHPQSPEDEFRDLEDDSIENINTYHVDSASASASTPKVQEENPSCDFSFSNDMSENMGSCQTHRRNGFEHQEAEDVGATVSSVTSNLQQLCVQEDQNAPPEEDDTPPPVIIPSHLQVQTADCSHLSFGSFGSGIGGSALSGTFSSTPLPSNMEETSTDADASSFGHPDTRNPEYYTGDPLRTASDENLVHRTGASGGSYDSPSSSEPEVLKQENTEAPHENQYSFQSSTSSYNLDNSLQQSSSHMPNLASFSSVMQAYTHTLPSSSFPASVQPVRESDISYSYSPFPTTQTIPTKYGNAASSIFSSTISIPEGLKTGGFSSTQPTPQTLAGSNIATGPTLPQHLAMHHPYSQPAVPLGPFANMIGYPFLPQSYTYMPSAFQQAFAGNSAYHQSLVPQYKNNVSVSNLPQSAAIASGYGGFGSSTTIPGNFSAASGPTNISYDDVMSSQYKDINHLISLQQNENSPMWVHGPVSRTMSPVPSNPYYSFQGQSQQQPSSGYRQTQQHSQNYGGLGYPNFYHSQTGFSLDHHHQQQHQQNPRDVHLSTSQVQASTKQSQQVWQNSY